MKKYIIITIVLAIVVGCCILAFAETDNKITLDNTDELAYVVGWSMELEDTWIISQELIDRLDLKPNNKSASLCIEGEDGEMYDWCGILKSHMDWVEERVTKVYIFECAICGKSIYLALLHNCKEGKK